jgi:4-carboxymuconolactone decarboxylase
MKVHGFAVVLATGGLFLSGLAQSQSASSPYTTPEGSLVAKDIPSSPEQLERGGRIAKELGFTDYMETKRSELADSGFAEFSSLYMMPGVYGRAGLTLKEREIAVIAMLITQGMLTELIPHFSEVAVRAGLSEREMQEIIFTGCFYAGWPKCSGAMSQFRMVMNGPDNKLPANKRGLAPVPGQDASLAPVIPNRSQPYTTPEGPLVAKDLPSPLEQFERGKRITEEAGFSSAQKRQPEMDTAGFMEFGALYSAPGTYGRGGLTFKEREIAVLSIIITQGVIKGLHPHFREVARRAGMTERELQEVIFTSCFISGWPKCSGTMTEFRNIMNAPNEMPAERRGLAPVPGKETARVSK